VVYYDAGMLIALLDKNARARITHEALTASPHLPIITGPVLAQVWRDGPAIVHTLAGIADECTILLAQSRAAAGRRSFYTDGLIELRTSRLTRAWPGSARR
jgi:hypothetical protein